MHNIVATRPSKELVHEAAAERRARKHAKALVREAVAASYEQVSYGVQLKGHEWSVTVKQQKKAAGQHD